MAHPFQQKKLLVTVSKASVGWGDQADSAPSGAFVAVVAGPYRACTRSVPRTHRNTLAWPPSLGAEMFLLTEDEMLAANLVLGFELWARQRGKWGSAAADALYAQAEISINAAGQAMLLSGQVLSVRLPMQQPPPKGRPARPVSGGPGGGAGGQQQQGSGGGSGSGAVVAVLALSLALQPADAEAAVVPHLPAELNPRLLMDACSLMPGAVLRSGPAVLYVDPCVVFIRLRLKSVSGLGRAQRGPGGGGTAQDAGGHGGGSGGAASTSFQVMQARLQQQAGQAIGKMGLMFARLKARANKAREDVAERGASAASEASANSNSGAAAGAAAPPSRTGSTGLPAATATPDATAAATRQSSGAAPPVTATAEAVAAMATATSAANAAGGSSTITSSSTATPQKGGGGAPAAASAAPSSSGFGSGPGSGGDVDRVHAEALIAALESNGFSVVDERALAAYFWCKVSYEGQTHTSRLMPSAAGGVTWDETFVLAALRPARPAPLELELYGSNDTRTRGKAVCTLSVPLCDVLAQLAQQERQAGAEGVGSSNNGHAPAAVAASAAGSSTGGADGAVLPAYHPNTWPRGRITLKCPLAGGGGDRSCSFDLEAEVVDADPRAAATATQLLPWASAAAASDQRSGRGTGGAGGRPGPQDEAHSPRSPYSDGGGPASPPGVSFPGQQPLPEGSVRSPEQPSSPRSRSGSQHSGQPGATGSTLQPSPGGAAIGLGNALLAATPPVPAQGPGPGQAGGGGASSASAARSVASRAQPPARAAGGGGGAAAAAVPARAACLCPGLLTPTCHKATLSLIIHEVELERANGAGGGAAATAAQPTSAATGGGATAASAGSGAGGTSSAPSASPAPPTTTTTTPAAAAAAAAALAGDYFIALRCGWVWACSTTVVVTAAGGGRLLLQWGVDLPLLHPSTLLTLALFKRNDTSAARKLLSVRTMMGVTEQLIGKLRIRTSSLQYNRPVTCSLPLRAERSGSRPCARVATARITALLGVGPGGMRAALLSYAKPAVHPPVAMLQQGAVAGAGLSPCLPPLDPAMAVDPAALLRRERRILVKWLEESSPGLPSRASRRLLDDGRQEFSLARTQQNWRRVARAFAALKPAQRFWSRVQGWQQPWLTACVAVIEIMLVVWPSRVVAVLLLAAAVHLWMARVTRGSVDAVAPAATAPAAGPATTAPVVATALAALLGGGAGGSSARARGALLPVGEPPAMVEDFPAEPESAEADVDSSATVAATTADPGPLSPHASLASISSATGTAAGGGPGLAAGGAASLTPSSSFSDATAPSQLLQLQGAPQQHHHHQPPPSLSASGSFNASGSRAAGGGGGGAGGEAVPLDPVNSLRQQFEGMVHFMIRVQVVLDDMAAGLERLQALFGWQDPTATALLTALLVVVSVAAWYAGLRVVVGVVLLWDIRPPRLREPWPAPPLNLVAHLPARSDLMT